MWLRKGLTGNRREDELGGFTKVNRRRPSPAPPQVIAASGTKIAFSEGDSYFAIPGPNIGAVVGRLDAVVTSNRELQKCHRSRVHGADASSD